MAKAAVRVFAAAVVLLMAFVSVPVFAATTTPPTAEIQSQVEILRGQLAALEQQLQTQDHGPSADPVGVRLWRTGTAIDADFGGGLIPVSGTSAYAGALDHNGRVYANAWTACEVITLLGGWCSTSYPTVEPLNVSLFASFPGGPDLLVLKLGKPSSSWATTANISTLGAPEPLMGSLRSVNVWLGMISVRSLASLIPNTWVYWQSGGADGVGEVFFTRKG